MFYELYCIINFCRQLVDLMEQLNFRVAEAFVDSVSNVEDQFTVGTSSEFPPIFSSRN